MQAFFPWVPLSMESRDGYAVVTLPVEIDFISAPGVADMLLAVLGMGPTGVIADGTQTRFCDVAGARAIARASVRAGSLGSRVRAVICHPGVRKVFALTGADTLVPVYPVLAAAVSAGDNDGTTADRAAVLPFPPRGDPPPTRPAAEVPPVRPGQPGPAT